jgi:hypothetical protein
MKHLARLALVAALAAGCASTHSDVTLSDAPAPSEPNAQWLHQLVGEWTCTAEAWMSPGAEPMLLESTESVRSIGGLWIQGEGRGDFQGQPFHSVLTLGYDADEEAFVGTWIDSFQTHLWTYRGELDGARETLTLEAEGPSFGNPNVTASYRDALTIVGPDHKRMTSSVLGEDGKWITFMEADYRRQK